MNYYPLEGMSDIQRVNVLRAIAQCMQPVVSALCIICGQNNTPGFLN